MQNRKFTLYACAFGVAAATSGSVTANSSSWEGSYVAEGQCYCTENQHTSVAGSVIPTPVGGMTVAQICERIGAGPELQELDGVFNYPVYSDPQCGNGPFPTVELEESCLGTHEPGSGICVGQGPRWNLVEAFSRSLSATMVSDASADPTGQANDDTSATAILASANSPVLPLGPRYITPMRADKTAEPGQSKPENTSRATAQQSATPKTPVTRKPVTKKTAVVAKKPTLEEIRQRQVEQLRAARERARIKEQQQAAAKRALVPVEPEVRSPVQEIPAPIPETAKKPEPQPEQNATEAVADNLSNETPELSSTVSALRLPDAVRASSREFSYVEALPRRYHFGGNGMNVAASTASHGRMQYLLDVSVAESYSEAMGGVGFFLTPANADRMTVLLTAGVEYGSFEFTRENADGSSFSTDSSESGVFLGVSSRFVVNNKFELQAGAGYSSFFEGDVVAFGAGFYHVTPKIDVTTKLEAGDNDSFGIGVRYYY